MNDSGNAVEHAQNGRPLPRREHDFGRAETPPLGIRTNTASPPLHKPVNFDPETGVVLESYDPTLKWQLQAVSRLALGVFDENTPYERGHRIRVCHRHVIGQGSSQQREVKIHQREQSRPYYSGLMTCGSVWVCPVCAAKIQQVRSAELRLAIDTWIAAGGSVSMASYTVPHKRSDALEPLLGGFNQAQRNMTAGKGWKTLTARFGIAGQVKGLETTWGLTNGWHPHCHTIYFHLPGYVFELDDLQLALFHRWQSSAGREGFTGLSPAHAVRVTDAGNVRDYITKLGKEYQWNAEHELVKSHSKHGRGDRYSPFDFLRTYLDRPDDGQMLALFGEYAAVFHGRKQLMWSRGFKQQLLADDRTDQQIADSVNECDPVLASLTYREWQKIRRWNMQGTVLYVAERHGLEGINQLLAGLES